MRSEFRFLLIRRGGALAITLVIAAVLIVSLFGNPAIVGTASAKRDLPIYYVEKEEKIAALSFDAAWGNEDTGMLIEILEKYDVKATFFVVGDWVTKYPESVKALYDAEHEIMNHSDKHKHMTQLSREQISADLRTCNKKIEDITGISPLLFRPPYGEYDDKLVSTARGLGMYTVQWNIDSLDWKELSAAEIEKRVLDRMKPGSIVLLHNAAKHTPAALPGLIEKLQADGYSLVKISEIIHTGPHTINHEGKQIPVHELAE